MIKAIVLCRAFLSHARGRAAYLAFSLELRAFRGEPSFSRAYSLFTGAVLGQLATRTGGSLELRAFRGEPNA